MMLQALVNIIAMTFPASVLSLAPGPQHDAGGRIGWRIV